MVAVETGMAVATGRNCSSDHTLTDLIASHSAAQLCDDSDGFMADGESAANGILPLKNMNVRPADRRQREAQKSVARPDLWNRLLDKSDHAGLDKRRRFHHSPRSVGSA
jgi:hypothetical protein